MSVSLQVIASPAFILIAVVILLLISVFFYVVYRVLQYVNSADTTPTRTE